MLNEKISDFKKTSQTKKNRWIFHLFCLKQIQEIRKFTTPLFRVASQRIQDLLRHDFSNPAVLEEGFQKTSFVVCLVKMFMV